MDFTAGITFQDGRAITVDVTAIDGTGVSYVTEDGAGHVPWSDVKALMLATTDHMLESAGSLFAMAQRLEDSGAEGAREAPQLRQFGFNILRQAAPRLCPRAADCGLRPGQPGDPAV
ncbi:MAG: hypothetical protein ACRD12_11615 [Acidimicrobiales bacterium]